MELATEHQVGWTLKEGCPKCRVVGRSNVKFGIIHISEGIKQEVASCLLCGKVHAVKEHKDLKAIAAEAVIDEKIRRALEIKFKTHA